MASAWYRRAARAVARAYLRAWHDFRVEGLEHAPLAGPALVVTNHASLVDVPALMATDPYPNSRLVAKASLFKVPVVRSVLAAWNAIPVERQGRDLAGVRALMAALRAGDVVAVAAEGRRTRSGLLGPVNSVLARIAVSAGVPIVPVGIGGSFRALPPGARLPRRTPITLRVGRPFTLAKGTSDAEAARRIQAEIAALLPSDQQPLPGDPS
jgi:1-acyl-sn-glycerol-3-phosphate acyltransferase